MSSAFKHICSVLAIAAAAAATDIASAQQIDSPYRDIRTGVYRGHVVSYEVIDGLAVWDGDIILGTPEELSPANVPPPGNTLDNRNKISTISSKESLWPGGIVSLRPRSRTNEPVRSRRDPALERKHRHPAGGKNGSAELGSLHARQRMCVACRHGRRRTESHSQRKLRPRRGRS